MRKKDCRAVSVLIALIGMLLMIFSAVLNCFDVEPIELFTDSERYMPLIGKYAAKYDLPPELVKAVIMKESRFRERAVGRSGEIGLMQLMPPGTAGAAGEWARVNGCRVPSAEALFEPDLNLEIGCWYLSRAVRKWKRYECGIELALAQYNAGEKRVKAWAPEKVDQPVLPRIKISSTRRYVTDVMRYYKKNLERK